MNALKILPTTNKLKIAVLILVVLVATILPASAWNNVGHRAVAEIAWRQLDKNQRREISDLLKQHPHYKELLSVEKPAGVSMDEWVFLRAAIWPDIVRPAKKGQPRKPEFITKYDLIPHAIGHPFLARGETNIALLKDFFIAKPNAEMVLSNAVVTLKNKNASAHDRAVSLCWVLHLTGDLHQPLHASNMVTKDKPRGCGLGGDFIALDPNGKQVDFHSFWDQIAGVDPSYRNVISVADKLTSVPELKPSGMKEYRENKTIPSWVQESFRDAVNFAYSEDHVRYVFSEDLASGKIPTSAIPKMSADYVEGARKIGYRRLALAGQRLADELKGIF